MSARPAMVMQTASESAAAAIARRVRLLMMGSGNGAKYSEFTIAVPRMPGDGAAAARAS